MKYNPSIAFDEMSGSAKGVTAAKTRGRKYIRNRGYGGSTRTSYQSSVKAVFKQLSPRSLPGMQPPTRLRASPFSAPKPRLPVPTSS